VAPATKDTSRPADTLRIHLTAEPGHLSPLGLPEREGLQVMEDTVFESLVRHEPAAIVPLLAESFRVTDEGLGLRFLLREGVRFHDGTPLSAVDVQFSVDHARTSSANPHLRDALSDVTAVEMWGPRDVRLVLRRANGYVLRALAETPIVPAAIYDRAKPDVRHPVGTGPYKLQVWERGKRILLDRHVGYWGTAPPIAKVEFVIEPDAAKALIRAKDGEIDIIPALIPEHFPAQASAPGIDGVFDPLGLRPPRFWAIIPNTRRPPFDDVRVRAALARLINRDRISREVFHRLARPIAGPVWPGGPVDGVSPEPPSFDPASAMKLLDEAGWRDPRGEGVRERDGQKLKITFVAAPGGGDSIIDEVRELVVADLRQAGLTVDVRPGDSSTLLARLRAGDFDAGLISWSGRVDDSVTSLLGSRGSLNWGGFSSRAVDVTLSVLEGSWDPAGRASAAAQLGTLIAAEWPLVPVVAPDPHGLTHNRVHGLVVQDGWFRIRDLSLVTAR
jgi:peptide/nickel transport system substrate-binding protein